MKHATLQTRLTIRLFLVLTGIGLLFGVSLNHHLRSILEAEVSDKAELIFSNLQAVQTYVREVLRPVMFESLPHDDFVIEAMSSSFVTRKIMSDFNLNRDQFTYRRVALDPRNPEYAANALERELIAFFQANPTATQSKRYIESKGEELYILARPVLFDKSCLHCHGRAADAPAVLLSRYGDQRGFGRFDGEIAGLDSLILPVERQAEAIRRISTGFILVFSGGMLIILMINHFFFDRTVAVNIGRLAELMHSRFPAEAERTLGKAPRRHDVIEGMLSDLEHFADHLREVKEQLSDYAANLEAKVRDRTAEARGEAEARQADVRLFLYVLEFFVRGADRTSLLAGVLKALAERFQAERATFYCFFSMNSHAWPEGAGHEELGVPLRDAALEGEAVFEPGLAVVPVQTSSAIRGGLCLRWKDQALPVEREREVLKAIGRQLGIALENLEIMESLLNQKAVLESIFEGIADPLFLVDAWGRVMHANESARQLTQSLAGSAPSPLAPLDLAGLAREAGECSAEAVQHEVSLPDDRSLLLRAYPLCGLGGQGRTIVYARDNTSEKAVLATLQQSEKSVAVGMLAAGMAHEINNPLGVILCYARLLADDGKSPHAADLDIIIRSTLQAQKVLTDLMRFASPKTEAAGPVNLAEVAAFLARVLHLKAAKAKAAIVLDIPADLAPVRGSVSAVEQILTNLLINALDALEENPPDRERRVVVSARADDPSGEVVLKVADTGPGVPEQNMNRLFDPFFTTKDVGKGTGLGLCVVYGLVRSLSGRIEVENHDGAVFTLHLPREGSDGHA